MLRKYYILIPACLVPFVASIFYFEILNGSALAKWIYLLAKIFILIYPLFFYKLSDNYKKAFKFDLKEAFIGLGIGAIILFAGVFILKIPYIFDLLKTATPFVKSKIENFGVSEHYILMAFIISFIHSFLEEYYWRWFVYGTSKSSIISAISFSLHHFIVLNFYYSVIIAIVLTLIVFVGGLLFNLLYIRKNNIWGAWLAHIGADLIIFYTGYLMLKGV
ncbi:MAG: CAAX amino terminal protease self- immunity [Alphaproteobacteria bacterium ADurb.Bin438]|nr:MAG: CAAX amino terminal protease self- immunity [Alphaproteobacteria bacterium ADurb.Bin438]